MNHSNARRSLAHERFGLRREAKLAAKLPVASVVPISHAAFLPTANLVQNVSSRPKVPTPLYREAVGCGCCSVFRSAGAVQNFMGRQAVHGTCGAPPRPGSGGSEGGRGGEEGG